jgi:hypothetical protein
VTTTSHGRWSPQPRCGSAQAAEYDDIFTAAREKALNNIAAAETLTNEQIEVLPYKDLEDPDEITAIMMRLSFRPAETYADRVLIVPGELGHDDEYRYVEKVVWEAPEQEAYPWTADPGGPPQPVTSLDPQ